MRTQLTRPQVRTQTWCDPSQGSVRNTPVDVKASNMAFQPGECLAAASALAMARENGSEWATLTQLFTEHGALVRLDRNKYLSTAFDTLQYIYFVRRGGVALEVPTPEGHIAGFWYSDELVVSTQLSALPGASLRAITDSELLRISAGALERLLVEQPQYVHAYSECSTKSLRQLLLTNAMLGGLTGEQRVASFLVSSALRQRRVLGNHLEFELEPTRADIADHLGLNADTLSRIMMGLQRDGIIEVDGRRRIVVRDWRGLCSRTPLADVLARSS